MACTIMLILQLLETTSNPAKIYFNGTVSKLFSQIHDELECINFIYSQHNMRTFMRTAMILRPNPYLADNIQ
jgi:hypothetical protein